MIILTLLVGEGELSFFGFELDTEIVVC